MIRRGIGVQSFVSAGVSTDADAQAFIDAAGITDATQQSAINTLVTDLKGYGIWSKMKAIYPMVGGTASTHKWNLKDPRDLDAAFRLVFSGGWTHSSTGALPNGTNGYANTYLNPVANSLTTASAHLSYYARTAATTADPAEIANYSSITEAFVLQSKSSAGTNRYFYSLSLGASRSVSTAPIGLMMGSSVSNTRRDLYHNGVSVANNTSTDTGTLANYNLYLGAGNINNSSVASYTNSQCAFASIGDGLTDTEAANLYTAVQKYQTTLGRSVGTQTVSDSDAQAFVNAAVIEDQVQATAINTLVTDLKTYGIWTKMKAVYPFVGGTSSTHKWNLKDPRDLDAAFRLVFSGGWTHSSNGATPNGTNAYADTKLNLSTVLTNNNYHLSHYSRTQSTTGTQVDMACVGTAPTMIGLTQYYGGISAKSFLCGDYLTNSISFNDTNTLGLMVGSRTSQTSAKMFMNNVQRGSTLTASNPNALPNKIIFLAANNSVSIVEYSSRQMAFASIGDGLTDTEAANLYTAVQAYQTTLSRNV